MADNTQQVQILQDILVAQVLTLAETIKVNANEAGNFSGDGWVSHAAQQVVGRRDEVFRALERASGGG